VTGTAGVVGETCTQINVRENWGPRFVVRDKDGKEQVLWGKDLRRCINNPHDLEDPFDSAEYHKYNVGKL